MRDQYICVRRIEERCCELSHYYYLLFSRTSHVKSLTCLSSLSLSRIETQKEHKMFNFAIKMRLFMTLVGVLLIIVATAVESKSNDSASDDSNPGDALYLTEYIDSGDIETVGSEKCISFVSDKNLVEEMKFKSAHESY